MIYNHANYRSFLRAQLAERVQKNPAYSLRAMARQLDLRPSQLSQALSGKANLSVKSGRKVAQKLALPPREEDYFCLLIQLESERSPAIRARIIEQIRELHASGRTIKDPGPEVFRHISEWYHIAILELVNLAGFSLTARKAATRLGIAVPVAREAIETLEQLGLLARDSEGRWRRTAVDLRFSSPGPNVAMRAFNRQMLEKVSTALEEQAPFEERLSFFHVLPLSLESLPELDQATDRYIEEIIRIAQRHPRRTEVYHLGVHLINLTQDRAVALKRVLQ